MSTLPKHFLQLLVNPFLSIYFPFYKWQQRGSSGPFSIISVCTYKKCFYSLLCLFLHECQGTFFNFLFGNLGVDLVAELVGMRLGPKGRNVVLRNKYGPPNIIMAKLFLKRSIWTILWKMSRVKLVREAGAKTNNLAGDGCTTSIVLARDLVAEGYCDGSKCCSS
ncbi:chaperonin 60 subunit beta 4, chloroplastic-like isoform X2 [Nicotiana tomentosiformis]|uniref:chaperonin 60 subunit beta 4, chloroplastic-like isoform X2 n=1 Tax=Nicotiana tomentosiformis TaxID=4098 RepID=UPI0014468AA4|nr:chaperonin 60 subunit beta 4, chloroplastic-like isoform X2 [Nicotiana tomentosiformis]